MSGWHGFFFIVVVFFVLRYGVWLSYRTGNEGGSCADLEARSPLSLTVLFFLSFFPVLRSFSFSGEVPLFEELGLGCPPLVMKP